MELCDLTLKKEVLREGVWEVLANFSKVENKIGTNSFLSLSSQKLFNQIAKIPNMTEEEVKNLTAIKNFLNDILKEFKDE
ncbi:hypothetical protein [Fusobacterium pseudoperiodonticum]|jgi:hypothetical protein|uniref:hypothetical protein n=1 Tax=Fusobacterium pseudoperiodonticum TaxID=2663009 RepID=UPI0028E7154D|nr:hypothetical protein [Fusobacterium pseudoperiodonticum]